MKKAIQIKNSLLIIFICFIGSPLFAQDPAKSDAKHYQVIAENNEVRVLRIKYGPGEKSVMHFHPESVAIFLTDMQGTFTFPMGKKLMLMLKQEMS